MQEVFKMFPEISKANPGAEVTLHPDGRITMCYPIEAALFKEEAVKQEEVIVELLDLVNDRQPVMGGSIGCPLPAANTVQVSEPAAGGGEAPKPKHKQAGKRIPCPEFTVLSNEEKQKWLRREVREAIDVPFEGLKYLLTLDNKGLRKSPRNVFLNSLGLTRLETINLQQSVTQYGRKKAEIVLADVKELING